MKLTTKLRGIEDVDALLSEIAPREAKNILRATVHDMAGQVAKDARHYMPEDSGAMVAATKHKRERPRLSGPKADILRSTVRVNKRAFYWRFLEYGDGPDGVAHGFFAAAIQSLKINMNERFLRSFGKKFEQTLARRRKKFGG